MATSHDHPLIASVTIVMLKSCHLQGIPEWTGCQV
jgi:hypothetical protein